MNYLLVGLGMLGLTGCLTPGCSSTGREGELVKEGRPPTAKTTQRIQIPGPAEIPEHTFQAPRHRKQNRAQIRALLPAGEVSEEEFKKWALKLALSHGDEAIHFRVMFFDHRRCLQISDSTLRDADWPHYLCHAAVTRQSDGTLKTDWVHVARDVETALPRTDVFRDL